MLIRVALLKWNIRISSASDRVDNPTTEWGWERITDYCRWRHKEAVPRTRPSGRVIIGNQRFVGQCHARVCGIERTASNMSAVVDKRRVAYPEASKVARIDSAAEAGSVRVEDAVRNLQVGRAHLDGTPLFMKTATICTKDTPRDLHMTARHRER